MARGPLSAVRPGRQGSSTAVPAGTPDLSAVPIPSQRRPADAQTGATVDALTAVTADALRLPVAARFAARSRQARRRTVLMVAAVAATLSLGIGAPLAYAYGESPGHHFGALTHYLEDDDR
jgi:hypothetical protein